MNIQQPLIRRQQPKVLETTDMIVNRDHLTTIMITHNMKDAIAHGNRLIMLMDGKIILDIKGEEKKETHRRRSAASVRKSQWRRIRQRQSTAQLIYLSVNDARIDNRECI